MSHKVTIGSHLRRVGAAWGSRVVSVKEDSAVVLEGNQETGEYHTILFSEAEIKNPATGEYEKLELAK